jgi:hypothetical protein
MVRLDAKKDGLGNIIITENSFEYLLACLDNQKFGMVQQKIQVFIDYYNAECRKILHQKYIFETVEDGYFLTKRYRYQDKITPWSGEDVGKVYELFKDTKIEWEKPKNLKQITNENYIKGDEPLGVTEDGWIIVKPESQPWLIERALRYDGDYLTISENGKTNRPWKEEEIKNIEEKFNGEKDKETPYDITELWRHQLDKMDISVIEQHIRKLKLKKL